MMANFVTFGLVVTLLFGGFNGVLNGLVEPVDIALVVVGLRLVQLLTYITKNLDEIKDLMLEDEDNMEELMYHPPYEVEE